MLLSPPITAKQKQNASSSLWRVAMLGALAALPVLMASAQAHLRGMYATKAEAEKRAAELKCKGTHAMGTMWMPCANERALHDALQKAQ
jgi:hypothetical protein